LSGLQEVGICVFGVGAIDVFGVGLFSVSRMMSVVFLYKPLYTEWGYKIQV